MSSALICAKASSSPVACFGDHFGTAGFLMSTFGRAPWSTSDHHIGLRAWLSRWRRKTSPLASAASRLGTTFFPSHPMASARADVISSAPRGSVSRCAIARNATVPGCGV